MFKPSDKVGSVNLDAVNVITRSASMCDSVHDLTEPRGLCLRADRASALGDYTSLPSTQLKYFEY